MALADHGHLYAWGQNDSGQLGIGTYDNSLIPIKVNLANIMTVSCGSRHTIVTTTYDDVYVWGNNLHGQLCCESSMGKNSPYLINI